MNILAFDSSSPVLSLALKKGGESISESKLVGFLHHAENLMPMIDRMLKENKLSLKDIDIFLAGRGPGSFTGLRIAFATLKGFLALKKKSCFGALSLDMIAENTNLPENSRLGILLDARREKIYARFYRRKKEQWLPEGKASALNFTALETKLPEEIYLAGDALTRYGENFREISSKKKIHLLPETSWYPRALTLIQWYQKHDKKLQRLETPRDFLPLYFRLSEAEEKRKDHVLAYC